MIDTAYLKIKYDLYLYKNYEKEILKRKISNRLLSADFYSINNAHYVKFKTDHLINIKEFIEHNINGGILSSDIEVTKLYEIQRELLHMAGGLSFYIISPSRIDLNPNYLFWDIKSNKMLLAYIPLKEEKDFIDKFWHTSKQLCKFSGNQNWNYALDSFYENFIKKRYSFRGMLHYLDEAIISCSKNHS